MVISPQLDQFGFALNKEEFVDAIALRYNFDIPGRSQTCVCGRLTHKTTP